MAVSIGNNIICDGWCGYLIIFFYIQPVLWVLVVLCFYLYKDIKNDQR